ncbi:MAG: hypothetical protein IPO83_18225 [Chitinophagaceae bacterium]|nr:hypothetical protein [Chitinophagaceae bacterium]
MERILIHYIGCTWGACYNTKFKELIQPYFDDEKLLDKILRTDIIKERSNVLIGESGARIFDLLLFELNNATAREFGITYMKSFEVTFDCKRKNYCN